MSSESDPSAASSLFEQLMAMPEFANFVTSYERTIDGIVIFNPGTGSVMVISNSSFVSLMSELRRKEGAAVDGMPVMEVKGRDEIESLGGECVICLEEWRVGDVAKEMPCQHKFHGGCVDTWLKVCGSCPVCRFKMPVVAADDVDRKSGGIRRTILITVGNNGSLSFRLREFESDDS